MEREWICVYVWLSPFFHDSPETIKTLLIGYTPIQNGFGVKKIEIEFKNSTVYLKFSTFYFKCIDLVFPRHQKRGGERERERDDDVRRWMYELT